MLPHLSDFYSGRVWVLWVEWDSSGYAPLKLYLIIAITLIATGFSNDCLPPSGGRDCLFEGDAAASKAIAAPNGTWDHNNNSTTGTA